MSETLERDYYIGVLFEEPKLRENFAMDLKAIRLTKGMGFTKCAQLLSNEYGISPNDLSSWNYVIYEDHNARVWMYIPRTNVKPKRNVMKLNGVGVTLYKPTRTYSRDIYVWNIVIALLTLGALMYQYL
jgi:hypothetical protein